jgi:hypothetical protein
VVDRGQALFEVADNSSSIRPARHNYRRRGAVDEFLHRADIVVAPGAEAMVRWKVRRKDGEVVVSQEFGDPPPFTRIRPAAVTKDHPGAWGYPMDFGRQWR